MKKISILFTFLFAGLVFMIMGCEMGGTTINVIRGTITGQVFNQSDSIVSDALITIEGNSTLSLYDGYYSFTNIVLPARIVMRASKSGYIPAQKVIVSPVNNMRMNMNIYMQSLPTTQPLDIAGGDSATDGKSTITVVAGTTMEDASGNPIAGPVDIAIVTFDPTKEVDSQIFPGLYAGRTSPTGQDEPFESFGFVNVSVTKSGQKVNLAHGATAEVIIPISPTLLSRAPSTIEVWSYNEASGYWILEGVATKVGSNYVVIVDHFSWYNWDWSYQGRSGYIKGRAIYANGTPFTGMYAAAIGVGYSGHGGCWLANDGTFTIPVLCGINKQVTIWGLPYGGLTCTSIYTNEPLVDGATYTLTSDIIVTDDAASYTTVESVSVSPASFSVFVGSTCTFSASAKNIFDIVLLGKSFTWSTSNPLIATVDTSGISIIAIGVSPGTCTIYATCEGKTGSATLTVYSATTETVGITPSSATLGVTTETHLTANARNNIGITIPGKSFTWGSSDPTIASVEAAGTTVHVWGNSEGTCTIFATCEGKTGTAEITVTTISTITAWVQVNPSIRYINMSTGEVSTYFTAIARNSLGDILSGKSFMWWSGNTGIATIETAGATADAWAVSIGTCIIYASCESKIGTAELQVY